MIKCPECKSKDVKLIAFLTGNKGKGHIVVRKCNKCGQKFDRELGLEDDEKEDNG